MGLIFLSGQSLLLGRARWARILTWVSRDSYVEAYPDPAQTPQMIENLEEQATLTMLCCLSVLWITGMPVPL